jgi:hypothetical protein
VSRHVLAIHCPVALLHCQHWFVYLDMFDICTNFSGDGWLWGLGPVEVVGRV